MNQKSLFECRLISKRYLNHQVIKSLSISIKDGERILLLGANGSGKSTLLKILVGLLLPDSGSLTCIPFRDIGYCGHELHLYSELTVVENLTLIKDLMGLTCDIATLLLKLNLNDVAHRRIKELSKGFQLRAALARALIHSPKNLFLDEPTASLDDSSLREFLKIISDDTRGFCLIVSHDLQRLSGWANRIIYLSNGAIERDTQALVNGGSSFSQACTQVVNCYREGNR